MSRGAGAPVSGDATGEEFWAVDTMDVKSSKRCGGSRAMSRGAGARLRDATGEGFRAAGGMATI